MFGFVVITVHLYDFPNNCAMLIHGLHLFSIKRFAVVKDTQLVS